MKIIYKKYSSLNYYVCGKVFPEHIRDNKLRIHFFISAGFFSSDSSVLCYCYACCPAIAQEVKGDPPASYSVPNGWCKFPLKKHLMTNNVDAVTLEKWHVAFVGVSVGNVRKILDSGQLIAPGNYALL